MINLVKSRSGVSAVESGPMVEAATFVVMLSISLFWAHLSLTLGAVSSSYALASQVAAFS